jgi:hypothetical protein
MLLDRVIQKLPIQSTAIRTAIGILAAIVLITVGGVVISQWLGLPSPPGVIAVLAVIGGASYAFGRK